ncbi:MAG: carboxypeptidase regulatory-like domain-containing protein [Bacteroidia bacterium]
MRKLLLLLLLVSPLFITAQVTQTIRGKVIDADTQQPLVGARVFIDEDGIQIGALSDPKGNYRLENVPIGRRTIKCTYNGYLNSVSDPIVLNSTKELVVEIKMAENIGESTTEEVLITARDYPTKAVNDLSVVSTRSFNAEETERYAASVNDPSRMALSLPGVQQGGDETENDIIIRGNSSYGVLWRLEGIDIPNPNHFARPGTSGGGVTVFSAQLLDRSDFSTGGMPAEYGNAIAGAFDVHFRKGNMEEREYRVKLGLLGLDFATEGPIQSGRSSYLVNYRYSTLSILNDLGFNLVGERVDNDFQDLSFNLAFNSKDGRSKTTWFGIGGLSRERYRPVAVASERDPDINNHWEDRDRVSNMGASGITHTYLVDEKSVLKLVVAAMYGQINYDYDTLDMTDNRFRYNTERYEDTRISTSVSYARKFDAKTRFKAGIFFNQIFFSFYRQSLPRSPLNDLSQIELDRAISVEGDGQTQTFQTYAQLSRQLTDKLKLNVGAHFLFLNLNNTFEIDPRISLQYVPDRKQTISFAYGIHSQILPLGQYFYAQQDSLPSGEIATSLPNFELEMIRSHHAIAAYNYLIGKSLRIGVDIYLQRLYQVPVRTDLTSNWWMLNNQSGVSTDPLFNGGKGRNYGANVFLEKMFSGNIFFLLTASRFESKFELSDGRVFDTRFGTRFGSSLTLGKEFVFEKGSVLQAGFRTMFNGGFRYTPVTEIEDPNEPGRFIYISDQSRINEGQVGPYFRTDCRISWRVNKPKFASVLSLDIQNVLNRKNPRSISWDASTGEVRFNRHNGGLIPILSYRIDF